jgi:tRNA (adenine22-N1)-methyltransferase
LKLSQRLSLLHSYHHNTSSIWDIGCDHGLLGLSFLEVEEVKEIHLVDPSSLVIHDLKLKLKDSYITKGSFKIHVHEKRGQDVVLNTERKTIFVAGMGGQEIKEILQALLPQLSPDDQVVISPHRKILDLREYLASSPFRLVKEEITFENDQYYQVMGLSLDQKYAPVSLYGEGVFEGEMGQNYKNHQILHFQRHKDVDSMAYFAYLKAL